MKIAKSHTLVDMVKTKKEDVVLIKTGGSTCIVCHKVTKNVPELCNACAKRLKFICSSNESIIDSGIAEVIQTGKTHHRHQSVRRLAHKVYKPDNELRVIIEGLQKRNKALTDQLRRQPIKKPRKACLGFKKKGAKSGTESITDLNLTQ